MAHIDVQTNLQKHDISGWKKQSKQKENVPPAGIPQGYLLGPVLFLLADHGESFHRRPAAVTEDKFV